MREVLYRAKTACGNWVEGFLVVCEDLSGGDQSNACYIIDADTAYYGHCEFDGVSRVIPETVGQFTGLYDDTKWEELTDTEKKDFYDSVKSEDGITIKYESVEKVKRLWKGKKIFEGDYVIHKIDEGTEDEITCIEYVGFMDGSFGFFDHIVGESPTKDTFTPFEYCILENTTFCGNIHDNPELLKGGESDED